MTCPHCDTPLSPDEPAQFCAACGQELPAGGAQQGDAPSPEGAPTTPVRADAPPASPRPFAKTLMTGSGALTKDASPADAPARPEAPAVERRRRPAAGSLRGEVLNGRFRVDEVIGEGGFGEVYRGEHLQMKRPVALKVLHKRHVRDPNLVSRFRREAQAAAQLRSAHTIALYDFDQTQQGVLFLAMELLKGRSLYRELLEGTLSLQRILHIVDGVADSLAEAHGQGIVHRDIKPENIFLEPRPGEPDFVKVLDFGIAKILGGDPLEGRPLTAMGETVGTLQYMSPEQLMGRSLDGRSDLYALGVVAFEMATATLPFKAKTPGEMINLQMHTEPPTPSSIKPGLPASFDRLIGRLLAKGREDRPADAAELRRELRSIEASLTKPTLPPISPSPAGPVDRPLRPQSAVAPRRAGHQRLRIAAAVAAGVIAALVVVALVMFGLGIRQAHGAPVPQSGRRPAPHALLKIDLVRLREAGPQAEVDRLLDTLRPVLGEAGARDVREIAWAGEPAELAGPGFSDSVELIREKRPESERPRPVPALLKKAGGGPGAAVSSWSIVPEPSRRRLLHEWQLPAAPKEAACALTTRAPGHGADLRLVLRAEGTAQAAALLGWAQQNLAAAAHAPEVLLMGVASYVQAIQVRSEGPLVLFHLPMDADAYRGLLLRGAGLLAGLVPARPPPSGSGKPDKSPQ